jgi:hypothetical protein
MRRCFLLLDGWCRIPAFSTPEAIMQDINPITHQIEDLKGRAASLRGYL